MINSISLLYALMSAFFSTLGAIILKKSAMQFRTKKNMILLFGASGFCYLIATVFFVVALKTDALSLVYPIAALQYLFIYLLGTYLLGEQFSIRGVIGIFLILSGVLIINV